MKKIFLVFNENLYFYSMCSNEKENVFCKQIFSRNRIIFFIARVMRKLNLSIPSIFYGNWKYYIKKSNIIVISDYAYCKNLVNYIKRKNPKCKVYFYFMNSINKEREYYLNYILQEIPKNRIFTFDPQNAKEFSLIFKPTPYHYISLDCNKEIKYDLLFVGRDKGRSSFFESLNSFCINNCIKSKIFIMGKNVSKELKLNKYISYLDYLELVKESSILLEIVSKNQSGISLRTLEAVFYKKKIITNNFYMKNYFFYDLIKENVFFLDIDNVNYEHLFRFMKKPYFEQNLDISELEFENWMNSFE